MTRGKPKGLRWRSFRRDERGSVIVLFALTAVILLMAVGAALDFARAYQVKAVLQSAVDGAALAAGSAGGDVTVAQLTTIVENYIGANTDIRGLQLGGVNVALEPATQMIDVTITGSIRTTFLGAAQIDALNVRAGTRVRRAVPGPLELVLALDVTRSMNDAPGGGVTPKITSLKRAAKVLIEQVMKAPPDTAFVGIVPYSSHMNVGMSEASPSWVNVPATRSSEYCVKWAPKPVTCTTELYDCYVDGVWKVNGCRRFTDPACDTNVCLEFGVRTLAWRGCIGARTGGTPTIGTSGSDQYLDSISSPESPRYPGIYTELIGSCTPEILDLTANRKNLLDKIDSLAVVGDTHIPSGLLWAWNLLDPRVPYTKSKPKADLDLIGGRKAIVLMTDGINYLIPRFFDGVYIPPTHHNAHPDWKDGTKVNELTARLCANIKAEGIQIYTIRFDVQDAGTKKLLTDCATEPAMSYAADNEAELLKAFERIGVSLSKLRIVQ